MVVALTSSRENFSPFSLDAVNFCLADVRGALGPYLNVFLVTQQHWSQSETGLVTMIAGLFGLAAQTPIGAAIGETRAKRGVIVLALAALAIGAVTIFALPRFWPVLIANSLVAVVGDVFGPALAGGAVLSIPPKAIDLDRARDLDRETPRDNRTAAPADYSVLLKIRPLVIFGLCVILFHFANAPLLPLVGQKLAAAHPKAATAMMSACIVAAQLVMLPMALLVGRKADSWGRKPLFLAGFGILPIRAVLYTFSNNSVWLIGVQLLDGVGAGIFGALAPLVIADIMRGTGRYNLALGAIATVQGIGASVSGLVAGEIVDHFGYDVAFLALVGAACWFL
jgi:MFS family permease